MCCCLSSHILPGYSHCFKLHGTCIQDWKVNVQDRWNIFDSLLCPSFYFSFILDAKIFFKSLSSIFCCYILRFKNTNSRWVWDVSVVLLKARRACQVSWSWNTDEFELLGGGAENKLRSSRWAICAFTVEPFFMPLLSYFYFSWFHIPFNFFKIQLFPPHACNVLLCTELLSLPNPECHHLKGN